MNPKRGRALARPADRDRTRRTVTETVLNRRRRYVLYYLRERSEPVDLDELSRRVAAWEANTTPDRVTPEERAAVGASLSETHLPYLAERDMVRFDRRRERATYCADDPELAVFLDNDPRTTVSWHRVYLLLTAVVAVFVGLVWVGVPPFGQVDPLAVAGVVVALFALASIAHWYDVYRWQRSTEDLPPDFLVTFEERDDRREDESEDENPGRNRST